MPRRGMTKKKAEKALSDTVTISYYTIDDVMSILGCGRTKASETVRTLNDELEAKGYMRYPLGKVPKKYFNERFNLDLQEKERAKVIG